MTLPVCAKLVLGLEDEGTQNPLDSIYKLHRIVTRAATPERIEWSLALMVDFWRSGAITTDQLSLRHIDGRGLKGSDGKGLVDLLCFKKDVLDHMLGDFMEAHMFNHEQKKKLRAICGTIESFRDKCGYFYNAKHRKVDPRAPAPLHRGGPQAAVPRAGRLPLAGPRSQLLGSPSPVAARVPPPRATLGGCAPCGDCLAAVPRSARTDARSSHPTSRLSFRQVDLQWRAQISKAEELALGLIEQLVFSTDLDTAVRTAVRNRKDVVTMLGTAPISGMIQDIDDALQAEETTKKDEFAMADEPRPAGSGGAAELDDPAVDATLPVEVSNEIKTAAARSPDAKGELEKYINTCWRKIDTHCIFLHETTDAGALTDRLKTTEPNTRREKTAGHGSQ